MLVCVVAVASSRIPVGIGVPAVPGQIDFRPPTVLLRSFQAQNVAETERSTMFYKA